ncbi:PTS system mannose/fructose/N-acetylgalactosamine-transporter subunit IIB [Holdemania massiliensis]|uniref:PTS system mannose/fructose/N-acetylgalactosamine-transporter subunit IIB n=1 Tax=Holdemania massiliensis TaxID=1468449 RepID=UPI001F05A4E1|nr:PTS sugar transporter subunit IIB [Holdemania massiliensis]MCH1942342.1 PTS sugar transporter subunit IIB [Holdemania massiliensis]
MILQLRLDERLIHGQVVTAWSRALNADTLMVANDEVIKDQLKVKMLLMTAPAGKKVHVRGVDESIRLLKDPRADKMRILLIVDNPADAIRLVEALPIHEVNVANYRKKKSRDKTVIHAYCSADPEDFELFKKLNSISESIFCQMLPSVPKENFSELLVKAKPENK